MELFPAAGITPLTADTSRPWLGADVTRIKARRPAALLFLLVCHALRAGLHSVLWPAPDMHGRCRAFGLRGGRREIEVQARAG